MAAYTVQVRPHARRGLRQLDRSAREAITEVIDGLAIKPRPPGASALKGHRPYLRVRSGDYRIIYAVDERAKTVRVTAGSISQPQGRNGIRHSRVTGEGPPRAGGSTAKS